MNRISDAHAGVAGEYLVCADLALNNYPVFRSAHNGSFDVVVDVAKRLIKIQVKTTRTSRAMPQRKTFAPRYLFHVRRMGKGGHKRYADGEVDIFALVALDTRQIGYVAATKVQTTMVFRMSNRTSEYRGNTTRKTEIIALRNEGLTFRAIGKRLGIHASYAHQVASGKETGVVFGRYLTDFTFERALTNLGLPHVGDISESAAQLSQSG